MAHLTANSKETTSVSTKKYILFPMAFLLVAVVGLFIIKWNPYYDRAFVAAATHSIGSSIITGKSAAAPIPSWAAALGYATDYFKAVWKAVILGLLLGSLVQVLIPRNWVMRVFGGKNFSSTAAASAASLPGMMCSCCAAPVTAGLRTCAASVGSALAFFLGNPVLNPATIIFMGFVLSWKFAMFRIIAGLILVFGISLLANRIANEETVPSSLLANNYDEENASLFGRWLKALWRLILDTIPAYLIVVFALGAARAWLFPAVGPDWGNSILAVIGLAIAGTLFVIPTAAEIPVVQTLMSFGLGVGPSAALLITLPAVSLPSILILKNAFPAKILLFVLAAVAVAGIISGLIAPLVL
ncbi:permease [Sporomusa aerivorans]|uniref:permease n=1 Tax=Sporomusa aerivorans TaxID=204936 RepID=UPI00352B7DB5